MLDLRIRLKEWREKYSYPSLGSQRSFETASMLAKLYTRDECAFTGAQRDELKTREDIVLARENRIENWSFETIYFAEFNCRENAQQVGNIKRACSSKIHNWQSEHGLLVYGILTPIQYFLSRQSHGVLPQCSSLSLLLSDVELQLCFVSLYMYTCSTRGLLCTGTDV